MVGLCLEFVWTPSLLILAGAKNNLIGAIIALQ